EYAIALSLFPQKAPNDLIVSLSDDGGNNSAWLP
ncbi:MAG: hypothetical protein JWQ02_1736, partial [Capsulimonas sp.]|nr:hypothetical protein [Capsulimonas sp.]